jgi:hypothetical protein
MRTNFIVLCVEGDLILSAYSSQRTADSFILVQLRTISAKAETQP